MGQLDDYKPLLWAASATDSSIAGIVAHTDENGFTRFYLGSRNKSTEEAEDTLYIAKHGDEITPQQVADLLFRMLGIQNKELVVR